MSPDPFLIFRNHRPVIPAIQVFCQSDRGGPLTPSLNSGSMRHPPGFPRRRISAIFDEVSGARYSVPCVDHNRIEWWEALSCASFGDFPENFADMPTVLAVLADWHSSLSLDCPIGDRRPIRARQHLCRRMLVNGSNIIIEGHRIISVGVGGHAATVIMGTRRPTISRTLLATHGRDDRRSGVWRAGRASDQRGRVAGRVRTPVGA